MNAEGIAAQIEATGSAVVKVFPGRIIREKAKPCFYSENYYQGKDEPRDPAQTAKFFEDFMYHIKPGQYVARLTPDISKGMAGMDIPFENVSPETAEVLPPSLPHLGIHGHDIAGHIEKQVSEKVAAIALRMEYESRLREQDTKIEQMQEALTGSSSFESKIMSIIKMVSVHFAQKNGIPGQELAELAGDHNRAAAAAEMPEISEDENEDLNDQVNAGISVIAGKIGSETPQLLNKLSSLSPEVLEKLAAMPDEQIHGLSNML